MQVFSSASETNLWASAWRRSASTIYAHNLFRFLKFHSIGRRIQKSTLRLSSLPPILKAVRTWLHVIKLAEVFTMFFSLEITFLVYYQRILDHNHYKWCNISRQSCFLSYDWKDKGYRYPSIRQLFCTCTYCIEHVRSLRRRYIPSLAFPNLFQILWHQTRGCTTFYMNKYSEFSFYTLVNDSISVKLQLLTVHWESAMTYCKKTVTNRLKTCCSMSRFPSLPLMLHAWGELQWAMCRWKTS